MTELELSIAKFLSTNCKMEAKVEEPVDECPICLEVVELRANRVITECGHIFHCKCLVTNIAHNGFACPYCRTAMAEEVEEEDGYDDDYDSGDWYYGPDEESDDDDSVSVAGPGLEAHLLRGMRWLFQRVEQQDDDDDDDDTVWETDSEGDDDDESQPPVINTSNNDDDFRIYDEFLFSHYP